jgi:hypothetical protein
MADNIRYNPPQVPNERENHRNEAHRRVVLQVNQRFDGVDADIDALIAAVNAFAVANNLSGFTPPKRGR